MGNVIGTGVLFKSVCFDFFSIYVGISRTSNGSDDITNLNEIPWNLYEYPIFFSPFLVAQLTVRRRQSQRASAICSKSSSGGSGGARAASGNPQFFQITLPYSNKEG